MKIGKIKKVTHGMYSSLLLAPTQEQFVGANEVDGDAKTLNLG